MQASNTLVLTQSATVRVVSRQKARNTLYMNQATNLNRRITVSASNALTMTQEFNKIGKTLSILSLTQNVVCKFGILNAFSTLLMQTETIFQKIMSPSSINSLILKSMATNVSVFNRSVTSTLTLTQTVDLNFQRLTQSIVFSQSVIGTISKTVTANNNLQLSQSVSVNAIFNRTASNVFNVVNGYTYTTQATIQTIIIPPVIGTLVRRITLLEARGGVIVLPTPNLSDTENYDGTLLLKRSIIGTVYTYIKNSDLSRLRYVWTLGRKKALELKAFLTTYFADVIKITNWKGEIWLGYTVVDPIELIAKSQWKNDGERIDVSIEFVATKIGG